MHRDEAFEFLSNELSAIPEKKKMSDRVGANQNGGDIALPHIVWKYWIDQIDRTKYNTVTDLESEKFIPFYDAAWEFCRIGILRPGPLAPRGMSITAWNGDIYTITDFGRKWLANTSSRPATDPNRMSEIFESFRLTFGEGYAQRATEAVRTYQTANYLAACVMAGAAAESLLLAVAIGKIGSEKKVLAEYNTSGGRTRVIQKVVGNVTVSISSRFQASLQVILYWRDDAGHGSVTTISEIEAHSSLTQLLRLSQFCADHWTQLTT